ncbi:MAG: PA2778 family cysteine peptidase [Methylophaga sp.]|nr:PA2778 family cysteine peptidase [Methylophaga sp.]
MTTVFLTTNTQRRLGVFFVLLMLLLSGCNHTPQTQQLMQLDHTEPHIELFDVPFFPQTEYQCGPAALATVLNFRDIEISPDELTEQVYVPERKGSLQIEMTAAARRQGLITYPINPSMSDLFSEVEAGNPVLVMQNLGYNWMPFWHYAVVVGFDLNQQNVILRSAETKRMTTPLATFERTWARTDYWGLVIVDPHQLPATVNEANWLRSAYDLQQTGQTEAALTAYQTAHQQWPTSSSSTIALTNLLFEQSDYRAADDVFARALAQNPLQADLWNNRAHVLKALQCPQQARTAAACGLAVAPDNPHLQSTHQTMRALDDQQATPDCPTVTCPW